MTVGNERLDLLRDDKETKRSETLLTDESNYRGEILRNPDSNQS